LGYDTGSDPSSIERFIKAISAKFSVKDLDSLHYFLSIEVLPTPTGLFLSQHKYIRELLVRTRMDGAKEVGTPLITTGSLVLKDGSPPANAIEYRSVIGVCSTLILLAQTFLSQSTSYLSSCITLLNPTRVPLNICCDILKAPSFMAYIFADIVILPYMCFLTLIGLGI